MLNFFKEYRPTLANKSLILKYVYKYLLIYLYKVCVVANGGGEGGPGIIRVGVAGAEVGRVIGRCEAAHNRLPVVGGQHGGRAEVLSFFNHN